MFSGSRYSSFLLILSHHYSKYPLPTYVYPFYSSFYIYNLCSTEQFGLVLTFVNYFLILVFFSSLHIFANLLFPSLYFSVGHVFYSPSIFSTPLLYSLLLRHTFCYLNLSFFLLTFPFLAHILFLHDKYPQKYSFPPPSHLVQWIYSMFTL